MKTWDRILIGCLVGLACAAAAPAASKPAVGQLRVDSVPPGASVSLDGTARDVTPLMISNVATGEHLLVVSKAGYRDTRQTIGLVADQRLALELKLEPIKGLVLVISTPIGAEVQIDDTARGRTPLLITELPLGAYRMTISATGYQSKTVELTIKDRVPLRVDTALVSDSAALDIQSDPSNATVSVNGIVVGTTPCRADRIQPGECLLKVTADGYKPYEQTLRLSAGQQEPVSVALETMPARLKVVSIPDGARIYIENQYRGQTPLEVPELKAGEYRIRAELPGHEPMARTITLASAAEVVEEFRMEANAGVLNLISEPAGVAVAVDGKNYGVTDPKPGGMDLASQPFNVEGLSAGTHVIRLTKKGFFPKEFRIEIKKDETVQMQPKLERDFKPDCEVVTTTGVVRGLLISADTLGNVRLEVSPGVFKTIPANEVKSRHAIPQP